MLNIKSYSERIIIVKNIGAAITACIILIALSAIFSSMETAMSSVNKIRLKHEAANGSKKASRALKLAESFDKVLTTILIGNNIVNILVSSLGTVIFTSLMGASGVAVSTAVITVLVLIFGEILPKTMAKQNAEKFAMGISGILNFFCWLFTPISALFMLLQKLTNKLFRSSSDSPSVTEDELKYIIEEIEDEGVLEEQESDLVRSALEFDDKTVEQILVPRVKIVAIEENEDIEEIMRVFTSERYSRLPVYEKSIDNIVGIITEKDFFQLYTAKENRPTTIKGIIQKAIYVSEMKHIAEVLYEMQRAKIHMAIVKDQYGGTSGLVTMEDIIEELVGEIYDENDEVIQPIISVGENMYEIRADLSLSDMTEELELPNDIIESESNTVGGWAMELFGKIPEKEDTVTSGIFTVTVLEADGQSVGKIGLKISLPENNDENGEDE